MEGIPPIYNCAARSPQQRAFLSSRRRPGSSCLSNHAVGNGGERTQIEWLQQYLAPGFGDERRDSGRFRFAGAEYHAAEQLGRMS